LQRHERRATPNAKGAPTEKANDNHCAAAGTKPRQGNFRGLQVADQKIDARTKTGTAPDENSDMRLQSAHKSLITDVQKASSPPLRNHRQEIHADAAVEKTRSTCPLTKDIRAIQRT
jgi:hypothetical protein